MVARWLVLVCLLAVGCGAGGDETRSENVPSVPPLPSPPEDVGMTVVEVDPVAFLLPDDMSEVRDRAGQDGVLAYYESAAQVSALPAGILVRLEDGESDLAERVGDHRSGLAELATIEELSSTDVPWPGVGDAVELTYTARPFMAAGLPLRTTDRLALDGDRTLVVSVSAPAELWDRLALGTVVQSLRDTSS